MGFFVSCRTVGAHSLPILLWQACFLVLLAFGWRSLPSFSPPLWVVVVRLLALLGVVLGVVGFPSPQRFSVSVLMGSPPSVLVGASPLELVAVGSRSLAALAAGLATSLFVFY